MDFFDTLIRYETDLWNHLDRRLSDEGAVSLAQLEALRVVHRNAGACRVQEVSRGLSITVGAASKLVDRLEGSGLAVRTPNPEDRRSALVALSKEGIAAHRAGEAVVERALADHLAGEDVSAVTRQLSGLRDRLRAEVGSAAEAATAVVTA
jgi:DNA-binding MarR family transcriptional regulator